MSAPLAALFAPGLENPAKKKRVLLIDTSRPKRDLRSETMRKLGIEVDCAADIPEARCWWRADLYDLVLINMQGPSAPRDKFCDDLRSATPKQQIMFLVGKPGYLSTAPNADAEITEEPLDSAPDDKKLRASAVSQQNGRWGILEACRRISAVRHLFDARAQAIRDRPLPPRDSELAQTRRTRVNELFDRTGTENLQ